MRGRTCTKKLTKLFFVAFQPYIQIKFNGTNDHCRKIKDNLPTQMSKLCQDEVYKNMYGITFAS